MLAPAWEGAWCDDYRCIMMYQLISAFSSFDELFQVKQLRYWGLSEVEFILKTMSNAKVHDELAFGAPETTCCVVLPDAFLGVSRGLQNLLYDIYMIRLNYMLVVNARLSQRCLQSNEHVNTEHSLPRCLVWVWAKGFRAAFARTKMRTSAWCKKLRGLAERCVPKWQHFYQSRLPRMSRHLRKNATLMDKELLHIMPKAGQSLRWSMIIADQHSKTSLFIF